MTQHSPSDLWRICLERGYITVEDCISLRFKSGRVVAVLQITIDAQKHTQERVIGNPLAMLTVIDKFRKTRDAMRADQVRRQLEAEQAKATAQFLERQRLQIAEMHRLKNEEEQRRLNNIVNRVRGPIQDILNRYRPILDQFAYTNVYGHPAEVHFTN